MHLAENERLWKEVDTLLKMIEDHMYSTQHVLEHIKSHKEHDYVGPERG
jgi:hypothetical protein